MEIIILGGFLGSGKTTILIQMAEYLTGLNSTQRDEDTSPAVAIIENEIGKIGIDNLLLKNRSYQVKNLFAGCVCCTLSGELAEAIKEIGKEINPKWLIIEATGVAYPGGMKKLIEDELGYHVVLIVLADSSRWNILLKAMSSLIEGQLETASYILINKIDLVSNQDIAETEASIRKINTLAPMVRISAKNRLDDEFWDKVLRDTDQF